ncbi:methyltransferase [Thaumasiovibrio sp. DFM-14]|uniref:methyltransferase n=1 Tax=Thaumasiovibrio sp. DFM-14 TaxID=3384792 RepID=UPI00399F719B
MKPILTIREQHFTLERFPARENDTLQAWDAADEYLINTLADQPLDPTRPVLIFNDSFGALSLWFSSHQHVFNISDSYISHQGCRHNVQLNQCTEPNYLDSLSALPDNAQLVIIKVPKNNRLLCWQLDQIAASVPSDCQVIAAGKVKEIHSSTLKMFEKHLGDTTTSLAVKKSRLIYCQPDGRRQAITPAMLNWTVPEYQLSLSNYANVFAGEKLDIGARFFLEHLPQDAQAKHIIDLGCGNGVIGLHAARLNPEADITCVDESYMAVASANYNASRNLQRHEQLKAKVNNCLTDMPASSTDWVLCNPPFHQQNAITDHIAWQMFCDAKHVLKPGGKLRIIGNRHLGYHIKLKRLFGNVKTIASNQKFVILEAEKHQQGRHHD